MHRGAGNESLPLSLAGQGQRDQGPALRQLPACCLPQLSPARPLAVLSHPPASSGPGFMPWKEGAERAGEGGGPGGRPRWEPLSAQGCSSQ